MAEESGVTQNRPNEEQVQRSGRRTGRGVVIGMFCFGLLVLGGLRCYWDLYTRPFRPLQMAIVEKFPEARPSVVGGRHKSHVPGTPRILRVVLTFPESSSFHPAADLARSEAIAAELFILAGAFQDWKDYDRFEVHLVHLIAEHAPERWSVDRSIEEWRQRAEQQPTGPEGKLSLPVPASDSVQTVGVAHPRGKDAVRHQVMKQVAPSGARAALVSRDERQLTAW
jgi:hypothetical protein